MLETAKSLTRAVFAFLIVLMVLRIIYPEGFQTIVNPIIDNLQLLLLLIVVWLLFSILKKKGD